MRTNSLSNFKLCIVFKLPALPGDLIYDDDLGMDFDSVVEILWLLLVADMLAAAGIANSLVFLS